MRLLGEIFDAAGRGDLGRWARRGAGMVVVGAGTVAAYGHWSWPLHFLVGLEVDRLRELIQPMIDQFHRQLQQHPHALR
jgi:hypothetical protein